MTATFDDKVRRLLTERRVHVLFATDQVVTARVRGDNGVYDLQWARYSGWSCTCAAYGHCSHVAAVDAVTMRPVGSVAS